MVQEKVMDFSNLLNTEYFNATAGYFENFKTRYKILFRTPQIEVKDISV